MNDDYDYFLVSQKEVSRALPEDNWKLVVLNALGQPSDIYNLVLLSMWGFLHGSFRDFG